MADFPLCQIFKRIFRYTNNMKQIFENSIKKTIAVNLKNIRQQNNLTQKEFGEKLGFSARTISDWENCNTEPDLITIKKIVKYFDITYEEIFE